MFNVFSTDYIVNLLFHSSLGHGKNKTNVRSLELGCNDIDENTEQVLRRDGKKDDRIGGRKSRQVVCNNEDPTPLIN